MMSKMINDINRIFNKTLGPGYIILVGVKELQSILGEIIKLRTKTLFFPIIANLLLVMNTISARWGWDGGDI